MGCAQPFSKTCKLAAQVSMCCHGISHEDKGVEVAREL